MPLKKPSAIKQALKEALKKEVESVSLRPMEEEAALPTTTTTATGPLVSRTHYERLDALDTQLAAVAATDVVSLQHSTAASRTTTTTRQKRHAEFTQLLKSQLVQEDSTVQYQLAKHRRWNMKMRMSSRNQGEEDVEGEDDEDENDQDDDGSGSFSSDDDDRLFGDYLTGNGEIGDVDDDAAAPVVRQGGGAIRGNTVAGGGKSAESSSIDGSSFAQHFVRGTYKEARRSNGLISPLNQPYLVYSARSGPLGDKEKKNLMATAGGGSGGSSIVFDNRVPSSILTSLGGSTQSALPDSTLIRNYEKRVARIQTKNKTQGGSVGGKSGGSNFLDGLGIIGGDGSNSGAGAELTEAERIFADYEFSEKLRSRSQRKRELGAGGAGGKKGAGAGGGAFMGIGSMASGGAAVAGGAAGGVSEQNRNYNQRLAASYSLDKR